MKKLLAIILVMILALSFSTTALAEGELDLGDFNWENNKNQMGWRPDGVDGVSNPDLSVNQLVAADYLVVEFTAPVGFLQIVWQGDSNSWGWAQKDLTGDVLEPLFEGNVLTIPLADYLVDYDLFTQAAVAKLLIANYDDDLVNTVVSAKLLYDGDIPEFAKDAGEEEAAEETPEEAAEETPAAPAAPAAPGDLPSTKNGTITSGSHVLLKWEGDIVSKIKGFRISFKVNNIEKYADSPDGADVQIVVNSADGWKNVSAEGGVFGEPNSWNNTVLPSATVSYTYMGTVSGDWIEIGVGNWNDMEGTFSVTVFEEAPATGVTLFIGIAAAALAISGTGAVVVTRRLRKK